MESFFARFKNVLVLIAVLLAQTIALAIQVRRPVAADAPDGPRLYLLRYWVTAAVTPFERLTQFVGSGVYGVWENYIDLRHAREQNTALHAQIAALRLEEAAFAEDAMQGHRLQSLLNFQQHYVSKTVAAQVIGTSGSDLSRILTLDKGSADGLQPEMAVITPQGVVGKLRDVFPHTSELLLLNDSTSGAGAVLQSTRIRAIVRGTPTGQLKIGNLTPDARIKVGDTVLTSGGDLVYPRGLTIGTIESIAPDPNNQPYTAIMVKPVVNLAQLEEVLVITETQTTLSPEATKDLAQGAASAGAITTDSPTAADLLSERLPSLHDIDPKYADPNSPEAKTAADGQQNPLQNPGGAVPKALPTIHPDRYTPGSTPPAVDMTPGASRSASPSITPESAPDVAPPRRPRRTEPAPEQQTTPTTEPPQ